MRRRRARRIPRPQGRRDGRRHDPRAGAGQPASARGGLSAGQPVRPRLSRPSARHRESGGAPVRRARQHERAQGKFSARHRAGPAGGDGRGTEGIAGGASARVGAQRYCGDDERARTAAASLFRRRRDRSFPVLGAAIRRHRNGRVDPVLRGASAIRPHRGPRLVSRPRSRHRAIRAGIRKARARHAALPMAGRGRSRSRRRGSSGRRGVGVTRARSGRARRPGAPSHPRVSLRPLPDRASRPRPCGPCRRAG